MIKTAIFKNHIIPLFILVVTLGLISGSRCNDFNKSDDLVLFPRELADSNNAYPSASLIFQGSGWNRETNEAVDISSAVRLSAGSGPVSPIAHGDMSVKSWPANHWLEILDGEQEPWVKFNPIFKEMWIMKDDAAGTGVPLNLVNKDYGDLAIRFIKGKQKHPWIINIPAEEEICQFAILRDWLFTSIMWDADGRTLIGRLNPHPPANEPAMARLNIRGHKNEIQFLIEADPNQTQPVAQIGNYGNREQFFTVDASGNIGIGNGYPENILTVKQNSATDPIADAWTVYSSQRWEEDIKEIEDALEKVKKLRGVSFRRKNTGEQDIGLIAEEVVKIVPETVGISSKDGQPCSIDYGQLVALLVEAIKEQQEMIDDLQSKVEAMSASGN